MHNSDIERLASEALSYIDRCEYDGPDGRAVLPQAGLHGLACIIGKLLTLRPDPALRIQPANTAGFVALSEAVGYPTPGDIAAMQVLGQGVERLTDVAAIVAALKRLAGDAAPEQTPEPEAEYQTADYINLLYGIRASRLSEAASAGRVHKRAAPQGVKDTQGRSVRVLYNVADVRRVFHCEDL